MGRKKSGKSQSSLKLTDKKHPPLGIVSMCMGIFSIILFIIICFVSSQSHGKAGIMIGLAGLFCFLLSVIAFGLAWSALRQENIRPLFPTLGAVTGGLSMVFYLLLYICGTFM